MDEYDDVPYWVILLMYESHDMRHTGFRRLTVVNRTPGFWGVTVFIVFENIKQFSKTRIKHVLRFTNLGLFNTFNQIFITQKMFLQKTREVYCTTLETSITMISIRGE